LRNECVNEENDSRDIQPADFHRDSCIR